MPDKTTVGGLPELPAPDHRFTKATGAFSADQMRAYATAALAQKDGEIAALREMLGHAEKFLDMSINVRQDGFESAPDYASEWDYNAAQLVSMISAALGSQA